VLVVSTSSGRLSRLEASRSFRWDKVPVTVVDLEQIVRGEYDENVERLAFQSTEVYAIHEAMAPLEAAAARERQLRGTRIEPSGNFPGGAGRVRDKIGAFAGLSGRTVEKIHQVREAARAERRRRSAEMVQAGPAAMLFSPMLRD
jgi:hypothetical protein